MDDRIAKNLLANRICDNCWYINIEWDGHKYCAYKMAHGKYDKMADIAKENTCNVWEADPDIDNPIAAMVRELREGGSRWDRLKKI